RPRSPGIMLQPCNSAEPMVREIGDDVGAAAGHSSIESRCRCGVDPFMRAVLHPIVWLCLVGLLLAWPVHAAPPPGADPNSELGRWFRSLKTSKGEICCSVADCRRPYAWRQTTSRGYQVQEGNGAPWLDVSPLNILQLRNPIGDAIACIVGGNVRCFIP